ncbi:MAG: sporulation transcriptional regulator SpoIIID [Opitutales bacterium]|nr:sporulation transcriptional regulator SpoIIID [Opitutales bacterium]
MDRAQDRAIIIGRHIVETGDTVRAAAEKFGVSKSTVHKDVSYRLEYINPALWREVKTVLEKNKSERHLRGGEATRQKYLDIAEAKR